MEKFYQSTKVIFNVSKIRKYLLDPTKAHFAEFEAVGYREQDDLRLFLDIEEQFDIDKAMFDRKYPNGDTGFSIIMQLGVETSKPFRTCWSLSSYIPIARFVTAYRIGGE